MVPLNDGAGARAPARRGAKTADEEQAIRVGLRRFLAGRSEWPTYREFQRAGLKGLRDKITRVGGAERWAREMGVPYLRHPPGYAPVWTEHRIRRDLRAPRSAGRARVRAGRPECPSRRSAVSPRLPPLVPYSCTHQHQARRRRARPAEPARSNRLRSPLGAAALVPALPIGYSIPRYYRHNRERPTSICR